ncbi:MAG: hypothetical protein WBF34_22065, partial [Streptosporangiaceae bacterium]
TGSAYRGRRALGWLAQLGLPARLVDTTGVVFTVAGWPAEPHSAEPHSDEPHPDEPHPAKFGRLGLEQSEVVQKKRTGSAYRGRRRWMT